MERNREEDKHCILGYYNLKEVEEMKTKQQDMEKEKLGWKDKKPGKKSVLEDKLKKYTTDRSSSLLSFYTFRHYFDPYNTLSKKIPQLS